MVKVEIIPFFQTPGGSVLPEDFLAKSDGQLSSQELSDLERELVTVFRALASGAKGIGSLRHVGYSLAGENVDGTVEITIKKRSNPSLGL